VLAPGLLTKLFPLSRKCNHRANGGLDPQVIIEKFLEENTDAENVDTESFWVEVDENLRAGKIRLVFFADEIPGELQRIVEFLREHLRDTEVLAISLKQYEGRGIKTLVPRVVGLTRSVSPRRDGAKRFKITPTEFTDELSRSTTVTPEDRIFVEEMLKDSKSLPPECVIEWRQSCFGVKFPDPREDVDQDYTMFRVGKDGQVGFGFINGQLKRRGLPVEIAAEYIKTIASLFKNCRVHPRWPDNLDRDLSMTEFREQYDSVKTAITTVIAGIKEAASHAAQE